MPLYEYKCVKCHKVTEKIEKVDGPHLKKCPHCGGKVEKMVSRSAIQFKGAGWYVTDYAVKKTAGDSSGSADKRRGQGRVERVDGERVFREESPKTAKRQKSPSPQPKRKQTKKKS